MQVHKRNNFVAYFGWVIPGAVILLATVAFPFWNLIPEYVTETANMILRIDNVIASKSGSPPSESSQGQMPLMGSMY